MSAPPPMPELERIDVTNLFGLMSRQPLVQIKKNGEILLTFSPNKAREIASLLLEAAEASEQDAFIFDWIKEVSGESDKAAARMLLEFREWKFRRHRIDPPAAGYASPTTEDPT